MPKPDIVLVQPPIQDFYLTKKRTIPYGLASISSGLRQKGFRVEILDALASRKNKRIDYPEPLSYLNSFYDKKDISLFSLFNDYKHFGYSHEYIGTQIKKKKPFIVGISSLFTAYSDQAIETANIIKKFYPDCFIVLGGHHPTCFPESVLCNDSVDFLIRGEGEAAMPELCSTLKKSPGSDKVCFDKIAGIDGVCFKNKDQMHISEPAWIDNLSKLSLPSSDLIDADFYQRNRQKSVSIVSSRGCPLKCSYCSVSASSSYGRFRQRPVEDVIKEVTNELETSDVGFIDFEDENLCFNKKWFLKLFTSIESLLEGRNIEIRAMNGLYPPSLDDEVVSLMKKCGFKTLNLSLGSSSREQLKSFHRPDVRKTYEKALKLAEKHNLECVSYIIAGAPGQTAATSFDDLLYLAQKRTLAGLSIYYPSPGSLDFQLQTKAGLLPESFLLMRSTALPFDDTTSRTKAVTLLRLARILNFMKALFDELGKIPEPVEFSNKPMPMDNDRKTISVSLLKWFLHDGIIRGITPDGEIFEHLTDREMAEKFSIEIQNLNLKGMK